MKSALATLTMERVKGQPEFRLSSTTMVTLVAATMFVSGCKVGPDYCGAPAQIPQRWIDADVDPRICGAPDDVTQWWNQFNDPTLTSLIASLEQQNLGLRGASFRIQAARSARGIAAGSLFPQTQTASGSYARINNSQQIAIPAPIPDFDNWGVTMFDATWELDFWGRFRRNIEGAEGDLQASIATYDDILVSLQGETAAAYIQLRTLERRLKLARGNVEIQRGSLDIAEAQFRNGAVTELDVTQGRQSLAQTASLIPVFEAGIRSSKNALCVLLGTTPGRLDEMLETPAPIPLAPESVCVGVPAELLQRRPDIRAAWHEAAAQSASIGVAITDLYPSFILTGDIGYQSQSLSNLLTPRSVAGAVGPAFSWKILNYGRLKNNIRLQEDLLQSDLANYHQTVLTAYQEVEDGLINFSRTHEQLSQLDTAAQEAEKSVELATTQYRNGAIDFNRVFTLQQNLVSQQDSLAATQGDLATQVVAIYKALGGGWQSRMTGYSMPSGPVPPQEVPAEPEPEKAPLPEPPEDGDQANKGDDIKTDSEFVAVPIFDTAPVKTTDAVKAISVEDDDALKTVEPVSASLPKTETKGAVTRTGFLPRIRKFVRK